MYAANNPWLLCGAANKVSTELEFIFPFFFFVLQSHNFRKNFQTQKSALKSTLQRILLNFKSRRLAPFKAECPYPFSMDRG